jgi:2-phospho-L-lactate guanylyltransferase
VTNVQATVATFDPASGTGTLLLDDGTELEFPAEAFANSGLRLLRLGQRVRLEHDKDGRLVRLTVPTLA